MSRAIDKFNAEKENETMTTAVMRNKTVYSTKTGKHKMSLKERFVNYMRENGAEIACGMIAMNGDSHAYRLYELLKNER